MIPQLTLIHLNTKNVRKVFAEKIRNGFGALSSVVIGILLLLAPDYLISHSPTDTRDAYSFVTLVESLLTSLK